jgi:hypothetical protein
MNLFYPEERGVREEQIWFVVNKFPSRCFASFANFAVNYF